MQISISETAVTFGCVPLRLSDYYNPENGEETAALLCLDLDSETGAGGGKSIVERWSTAKPLPARLLRSFTSFNTLGAAQSHNGTSSEIGGLLNDGLASQIN